MADFYDEILTEEKLEELLNITTATLLRYEGLRYFYLNKKGKRGYLLSSVIEFFKAREINIDEDDFFVKASARGKANQKKGKKTKAEKSGPDREIVL